jgi:hypothetical protein
MKRTIITLSIFAAISASSLLAFTETQAFSETTAVTVEPALWGTNASQKSAAWSEELLGQVVTYQTLAEKGIITGDFDPYLKQMGKVREDHRAGDRRATYDGVNTFMVMLEARVGGIDGHSADALWDFCYRVTPDEFHARDRHVRAKGAEDVKNYEDFIRNMEERASMSF